MAGRSKLKKLMQAVETELKKEELNDFAEKVGTPRRARKDNVVDEVCVLYKYKLAHFLSIAGRRALSRDRWNDVAERFGLPRRKSYDDIFAELRRAP